MRQVELIVLDAFDRYWAGIEKALDSREALRLDALDETARFSPPFRFPPRDELPDGTTAPPLSC